MVTEALEEYPAESQNHLPIELEHLAVSVLWPPNSPCIGLTLQSLYEYHLEAKHQK